MPDEIICVIMEFLSGLNLLNAACVNKKFNKAACLVRNARNRRVYEIITSEVLAKFSATCWAVAGSASLWLWLYVKGGNPFWTPNDIDVWYLIEPNQEDESYLLDLYTGPPFPGPGTQPSDVPPFQMNSSLDEYRTDIIILRRGMKIQLLFSPSTVHRHPSGRIKCAFDIGFLQIAVTTNSLGQFVFHFSQLEIRRPILSHRFAKYAARMDLSTMCVMRDKVEKFNGVVAVPMLPK